MTEERKYTEVVYNNQYGGFSLSNEAILLYLERSGITVYPDKTTYGSDMHMHWLTPPTGDKFTDDRRECFWDRELERTDPLLIEIVKELGEKANGQCATLKIAKIPCGTLYRIKEYDGNETIETMSDCDWSVA